MSVHYTVILRLTDLVADHDGPSTGDGALQASDVLPRAVAPRPDVARSTEIVSITEECRRALGGAISFIAFAIEPLVPRAPRAQFLVSGV